MAENDSNEKHTELVKLEDTDLKKESLDIINKLMSETDPAKTDELVELFNINQRKKTMTRVNKMGDLLDIITDQTIERFTKRPDEITTQEIIQALKATQDVYERGQQQLANQNETPLIQINQQNNDINIGDSSNLTRDSKNNIKNAVANILANIAANSEPIHEIKCEDNDDE